MMANALIQQLAAETGLPSLALGEQGTARLSIDGRWNVDFEWDETNGVLHLCAEIGKLPLPGRENVLMKLLSANYLGLETSGAALSLAPESEEILLCARVDPEKISFAEFKALLEGFLAALERLVPEVLEVPAEQPFLRGDDAAFFVRA